MEDIFLVTSGSYSDYRVCAVFTTKELAQKYIDSFKADYNEFSIETYKLNPYNAELTNGYKAYFVRMTKDGACTECEQSDSSYGFDEGSNKIGYDMHKNMYIHVFAKDKEHAIKITNEKRAEQIALNMWPK